MPDNFRPCGYCGAGTERLICKSADQCKEPSALSHTDSSPIDDGINRPRPCADCDIYPCDHTGCDCGGEYHNPGPDCPGQPPYRLHERCPDCNAKRRGTRIKDGIETAAYACGRIDRIDTEHGMGEIRTACVGAHPVELFGAAVIDGGTWFAGVLMDAPMVKDYRNTVKVYGNHRDWFMRPDTARSMASALQHYADRAEAFRVE